MENFDDFENKSYVKARKINYKLSDHLSFALNSLLDLCKIIAILVPELIENFIKLFQSAKPKNISGQLALVTGGANGLGRAIAFRLAKEKCNIVIVDLNISEAEKTAAEIAEQFGVTAAAFKVDVSNFNAIQQLKIDIEKTLGTVDILINNAGILSAISLREGRPEDVQKVIDVNLTSHFWTVRTFLDTMIEKKRGHIVAISSFGGKVTFPLACLYCATKFGVKGFMGALFDELCVYEFDDFIKTTTVYPGFINTRKELSDVLDQTKEMAPRMSPRYVADSIVTAMLVDKRELVVPSFMRLLEIANILPTRTLKFTKTRVVPVGHLKKS